ncbi:MAG: hypothetical protein KDE31_12450, partial [Caldilineaceae bacterium]|nr:hypothetical protein [Caldilineaceae bacterium]
MTTPRQPITPSHLVSMATAAGIVTDHGYQWLPAHRLLHVYHPTVEVELPLLITGIRGRAELLRLVQTLANAYPPEHLILLFPSLPSTAAQTSSISAVLENGTAENTDQSDFAMI